MVESEENKLFVRGLTRETSSDTLRDYFSKYGDVISSVVAKDRVNGSSRGFAFVSFSDHSAVDKALEDTHVILERKVEVRKAVQRQNQQQHDTVLSRNIRSSDKSNDNFRTKKIFVGGLSASLTDDEFKSYFEKFGRITDVVVMHDNVTKRPRGFGFITFDSEDAVEDVVQKSFHELCGKNVEVKKAVPKEGNNNGNNGYRERVGSGRGYTLNSYQHGDYPSYTPRYGYFPGYVPFPGYGGYAGYTYGAHPLGAGYLTGGYGGMGYGVAPFIPRSPWNGHTMVGNVYPSYYNGGAGVMGVAARGYDGTVDTGVNGSLSQLSLDDSEAEADATNSQVNEGDIDGSNSCLDQSCGAAASKEDQRGIDVQSRTYAVANSS